MNTDFIEDLNRAKMNDKHIEAICRKLASGTHIYDGSNMYGRTESITFEGETFTPTTREIVKAVDMFRPKGWFGVYDSDCGYYAVYKNEPTLGEYQRRYTKFLFRPSFND